VAETFRDLENAPSVGGASAIVIADPSGAGAVPVPAVGGLDTDLFREGETVEVDGSGGWATLPEVRAAEVVTAFLVRDDGRVLLLRRSAKVGSFVGRWAGVSGYLEEPSPEGQARTEIREETGLAPDAVTLERAGEIVYARDGATVYVVHPFLFRVGTSEIRLDWEHTELAWVDPVEIGRRPTVPKLDRAWRAVASAVARKR